MQLPLHVWRPPPFRLDSSRQKAYFLLTQTHRSQLLCYSWHTSLYPGHLSQFTSCVHMYIFGVILFLPVVMLDSTLYNIYLYFFADVKLQKSWPAVTELQFRGVVTHTVRSSIVRPETRRDFVAGAVHPRRYPTLLWSRGFCGVLTT